MFLVFLLLLKQIFLVDAGPIVNIKGTLAAIRENPDLASTTNADQRIISAKPVQNTGALIGGHDTAPLTVTQNPYNAPEQNSGASIGGHDTAPVLTQNSYNAPDFAVSGLGQPGANSWHQGSILPHSHGLNVPEAPHGPHSHHIGSYGPHRPHGPYITQQENQQGSFRHISNSEFNYNSRRHGHRPSRRHGHYSSHRKPGFGFSRNPRPRPRGRPRNPHFRPGFEHYPGALRQKRRTKRSGRLLDGIISGIKKDIFNQRPITGIVAHKERTHRANSHGINHSRNQNNRIIIIPVRDSGINTQNNFQSGRTRKIIGGPIIIGGQNRRNNQEHFMAGSHRQIVTSDGQQNRRNNHENIPATSNRQIFKVPARAENLDKRNNPENIQPNIQRQIQVPNRGFQNNPENIQAGSHRQISRVPAREGLSQTTNRVINGQRIHENNQKNSENVHSGSQNILQGIINGIRRDMFSQRINHQSEVRNPARVTAILNNVIQRQNPELVSHAAVTTVPPPTSISPVVGTPRK